MELILTTSVRYGETKILEMKLKKSLLFWLILFVIAGSMLAAYFGNVSMSFAASWKLISYGAVTNPTPAAPNVDTSLTFGSDGKLNGNVGCNSFNGDYKIDGSRITFGPIASTMMACAGPIMQQEGAIFNVFTNSAPFKIDGNTLTITSADGGSAAVFERK